MERQQMSKRKSIFFPGNQLENAAKTDPGSPSRGKEINEMEFENLRAKKKKHSNDYESAS